jgi:putative NADH-flavin reductase
MNTITGKTILITGANRGIGQALLEEALRRGAQQVYAGTRAPFAHPDQRVTPLLLDVTDTAQTQQAAGLPLWVCDVRPGREQDTTCAKAATNLLQALEFYYDECQMPTLTDLGYVN